MFFLRHQFDKIYNKYLNKIYRFVYLKIGSQETAEDLTAQVFIKYWRKLKDRKRIKNIQAYLYQIARREVIDFYRRQKNIKIIFPEFSQEILEQIIDSQMGIEEKLILQKDLEIIYQTLAHLSDNYQNLIIWYYLDELRIKEIAEIMEKSEGAVRVMLFRALQELREKLKSKL